MTQLPEIDPSAVVRNSDFGRYTCLGPRSMVADGVPKRLIIRFKFIWPHSPSWPACAIRPKQPWRRRP